ncbi:MAG: hypothetical protein A3G33_04155 [Omnitrophica bacterium RIFCSPLOWO2_12_FULL_44_17]|uniref:Uncharacterized protein n=1 Tax=Candidatus Danuiimicrobium aquiferis TaxID=1801832 RepID=A0A1G1KQM2_9BACT|nr:MAG: hypothetical protein A3B72_10360 [Omnitrophica bacterium RIFCSPHIGHO2_02_FULL_45_28]OGW90927.1 MAG: hypothetical protein A3E74_00485 [Omnitrophica bacterium RIFCSPHIGHO2_12_FULL_44_12]OGW95132.1 MAG: hypothetical protein A3G33_04155 [Omnitrophica bacterium RIFCSPLOWO2_12_FULL_44_17]OGX01723.1 MAG: hypothetical protein A3J12_04280 [Omnitrophica bacterium RIFCSPLOWO2_02_FULL_44_11]
MLLKGLPIIFLYLFSVLKLLPVKALTFCHSRESGNPVKMLDARLKHAGMTEVKTAITFKC